MVEKGARGPPETEADDGEGSDSLASEGLGGKTTRESVGFMPRKSWKTGLVLMLLALLW